MKFESEAHKAAFMELMSHAKRANQAPQIKFRDEHHEQAYHKVLSRMKRDDAYHRSAAYLIALADLVPNDVFDFEEDGIKHTGLFHGWQTHSSRKATRLMFSLWNGCYQDHAAENPEETSSYYTVDEIFSNGEYAPWFYEAIKIRFERV